MSSVALSRTLLHLIMSELADASGKSDCDLIRIAACFVKHMSEGRSRHVAKGRPESRCRMPHRGAGRGAVPDRRVHPGPPGLKTAPPIRCFTAAGASPTAGRCADDRRPAMCTGTASGANDMAYGPLHLPVTTTPLRTSSGHTDVRASG